MEEHQNSYQSDDAWRLRQTKGNRVCWHPKNTVKSLARADLHAKSSFAAGPLSSADRRRARRAAA